MCARFVSLESSGMIAEFFGAHPDLNEDLANWPPRYNVAPTQAIRVIMRETNDTPPAIDVMRWGLIPRWQRTDTRSAPLINARAETASEKPSFRDSFIHRRCVVAMTGFYEWTPGTPKRQPHLIRPRTRAMLAVAGIWNPAHREFGPSVAILTTAANRDMARLHDRMPVLLDPDTWPVWLDPELEDVNVLAAMVSSVPDGQLQSSPVSTVVNSVRAEGPHLFLPPAATSDHLRAPKPQQLFTDEFGG